MKFNSLSGPQVIDVMVAISMLERMRGLLARPALRNSEAMLLRPCNMIHTFGMRYPIDVLFLRRDGLVLKIAEAVVPRRTRSHLRAHGVLELAAGEARRCGIVLGAVLPIHSL